REHLDEPIREPPVVPQIREEREHFLWRCLYEGRGLDVSCSLVVDRGHGPRRLSRWPARLAPAPWRPGLRSTHRVRRRRGARAARCPPCSQEGTRGCSRGSRG